ncbi:hypothetical protein JCM18918_1735 [Cutibacterium acnes JCM 18918]|nr:hypothetical protein JCM18918_1735 [Cutibacterium acnes JCM 18918]
MLTPEAVVALQDMPPTSSYTTWSPSTSCVWSWLPVILVISGCLTSPTSFKLVAPLELPSV